MRLELKSSSASNLMSKRLTVNDLRLSPLCDDRGKFSDVMRTLSVQAREFATVPYTTYSCRNNNTGKNADERASAKRTQRRSTRRISCVGLFSSKNTLERKETKNYSRCVHLKVEAGFATSALRGGSRSSSRSGICPLDDREKAERALHRNNEAKRLSISPRCG